VETKFDDGCDESEWDFCEDPPFAFQHSQASKFGYSPRIKSFS